jgi:hypothetical protein
MEELWELFAEIFGLGLLLGLVAFILWALLTRRKKK